MTAKGDKATKTAQKLYIRCSDVETIRGFKRIKADFATYEDVLKWLNANYVTFSKIVPPHPVKGGML